MANPFFTIGHSTRPLNVFAGLLKDVDVRLVVDVRTVPRSRRNPQYNSDVLPASLSTFQIEYAHIAALGGLRAKQPDVSPVTYAFWQNQSFHNYADYAMGVSFRGGFSGLRELGHSERCVIMCAEILWWRCHRRIISDYLIVAGETVFHIIGPNQINRAQVTREAKITPTGTVTYPADI